jgi:hypothetical protein
MKRLWQFLALVLLALMVPASVCCMGAQQVSTDDCGCCSSSEKDEQAPAQPEVCPSDTISRSQLPTQIVTPEMEMVAGSDLCHAMMRLHELVAAAPAPVPLMTTAPPELRTTWVFASRAALPARAPSELA